MVADEHEMRAPSRQGKAKEKFWRKTLARFVTSGLSQVEFCKREGLNPSNLGWWKREIATRDAKSKKDQPMESQRPGRSGTQTYWRTMIARFNTSGLSKDDFCAREGIKPAAFCWWRGELSRRDAHKSRDFARPFAAGTEIFVPLTPANPKPARQVFRERHVIAEIDIATGTVRIFETQNADGLLALVKVLKELFL
jgi:hypothetical protein